jgi:hypothetical protein
MRRRCSKFINRAARRVGLGQTAVEQLEDIAHKN